MAGLNCGGWQHNKCNFTLPFVWFHKHACYSIQCIFVLSTFVCTLPHIGCINLIFRETLSLPIHRHGSSVHTQKKISQHSIFIWHNIPAYFDFIKWICFSYLYYNDHAISYTKYKYIMRCNIMARPHGLKGNSKTCINVRLHSNNKHKFCNHIQSKYKDRTNISVRTKEYTLIMHIYTNKVYITHHYVNSLIFFSLLIASLYTLDHDSSSSSIYKLSLSRALRGL